MSKEYIEREALLERLSYNGPMNLPPMEYYREVVMKFPTVDVAPVVHGEWIVKLEGMRATRRFYCSVCGKKNGISGRFQNQNKRFCPNCGAQIDRVNVELSARMDGGN